MFLLLLLLGFDDDSHLNKLLQFALIMRKVVSAYNMGAVLLLLWCRSGVHFPVIERKIGCACLETEVLLAQQAMGKLGFLLNDEFLQTKEVHEFFI